ncbi:hypothetical protein L3X38_026816 [Prunus dulcis]|uniref:Reverse transcriptase Ty1/copia-type domain-containing protein n=1 Tax=Prunus dulcis TaxID=3755 RepID=A0AAD4VLP8_PRUDU|nr:hypothetical protein L3X38_026816 [Prunus dulcis]
MIKSICILLAIAAYYDYKIWQMDVKTAFLNGHFQEEIYMDQPEGFISKHEDKKVCKLQRSIYGLKQALRSWNMCFDEAVKGYDFRQNEDEPCVYKKNSGSAVVFLVLFIDDILMFGNDIGMLTSVKLWLSKTFSMKDLGARKIPNGTFQEGFSASKDHVKVPQKDKGYVPSLRNPELLVEGYTDSYFEYDVDDRKSTFGYVFTLNGGAFSWRYCK